MWIDSKSNLEFYIVETVRKIEKLNNFINELLTKQYPTETPIEFLVLIKKSSEFIKADIINILKIVQNLDESHESEIIHYHRQILGLEELVIMFWSHLKFVDGTQTHKVPWSIVPSIERLLQEITNDFNKKLLFRPQWTYNFSVRPIDISSYYRNILIDRLTKLEFQHTNEEIDKKIFRCRKPDDSVNCDWCQNSLYIFSFPGIDKKNIIMHCIIGHEIGHLILDGILTQKFFNNKSSELRDRIIEYWHGYHKSRYNLDLFDQAQIKNENQISMKHIMETFRYFINEAQEIWKKGLNELAADFVGVLLFGPSFLMSLYFFSVNQNIDDIPKKESNYYPPRRLRLRLIYNYLEKGDYLNPSNVPLQLQECFKQFIQSIKKTISKKADEENIKNNDLCNIVYHKLIFKELDELKNEIYNSINQHALTVKDLYSNMDDLMERLENQIPPNAIEENLYDHKLCSVAEILNSSWIYNLCYNGELLNDDNISSDLLHFKDLLDRITLKGIEFSDLEKQFNLNHNK